MQDFTSKIAKQISDNIAASAQDTIISELFTNYFFVKQDVAAGDKSLASLTADIQIFKSTSADITAYADAALLYKKYDEIKRINAILPALKKQLEVYELELIAFIEECLPGKSFVVPVKFPTQTLSIVVTLDEIDSNKTITHRGY